MPCYHPITAYRFRYRGGKPSSPMFCLPPDLPFYLSRGYTLEEISLPCGRCIGCRLERSRQWAMRCVHEASFHEKNSFITLTYDNDHVPDDYSLKKRDFQLFMKRLRKAFPHKIRFFAAGEYGETTFRPHYHAILFGHQFDDLKMITRETESGVVSLRVSPKLTELWGQGFASSGDMTFESAAYVARYCLKKINGPDADIHYMGREPEFSLMSRMPGIGADWLKMYRKDVYPNDICFSRGRPCKPPRYYDEQLKKIDEILLEEIKEKRYSKFKPEEIRQGDNSPQRLLDREKVKILNQKKIYRKF